MTKRRDRSPFPKLIFAFAAIIFAITGLINFIQHKESAAATVCSAPSVDAYTSGDLTLISGTDLKTGTSDTVMACNTANLQAAMDKVSASGGGSVYLPAGEFHFSVGGQAAPDRWGREFYVIRAKDNVHLIGKGIKKDGERTILKPHYSDPGKGSMDMFYFNNYADSGYQTTDGLEIPYKDADGNLLTLSNEKLYLTNADFSYFIIDAENVHGGTGSNYNTSGKGFMLLLNKDCDWDNVVVMNTDATGYGVDAPINATVSNSYAINCGKADTNITGGASGFGIGTGYADNEFIRISNSVAINNRRFGFFFEHQGKFSPDKYTSVDSEHNGFVVSDSKSYGNKWGFGSQRGNDIVYENVTDVINGNTYTDDVLDGININSGQIPVYFDQYSLDTRIINSNIQPKFTDTTATNSIKWALNNGIVYGTSAKTFSPNQVVSRASAAVMLYRYTGLYGDLSYKSPSSGQTPNLRPANAPSFYASELENLGFTDIDANTTGLDAIFWLQKNDNLFKGTSSSDPIVFSPNNTITTAQLVTMLYRLADDGDGKIGTIAENPFTDVNPNDWFYEAALWAYGNGIIKTTTFNGNAPLTRLNFVNILYDFSNRTEGVYDIKTELQGGTASSAIPTSYTNGTAVSLPNLTRSGYTFDGWTGSNGSTPTKNITIPSSSTGNLAYTANWTKILPVNTASYTVKHYRENANDSNYTLYDTDSKTGDIGAQTAASAKAYTGFTAQTFSQSTIAGDGSTVVNIYYNRNSYTLTYKVDGTTYQSNSYKYGAALPNAPTPTKDGYTFSGWDATTPSTMPANNLTISGTFTQNPIASHTITFKMSFTGAPQAPSNFKVTNDYNDTIFTLSNASSVSQDGKTYTWTILNVEEGTNIRFTASGFEIDGYTVSISNGDGSINVSSAEGAEGILNLTYTTAEPSDPTPTDPDDPTPTDPDDPTPTDPDDPTPTDPDDPTPTDPDDPTPTDPDDPTPTDPDNPSDPSEPDDPAEAATPETPKTADHIHTVAIGGIMALTFTALGANFIIRRRR